MSLPIPLTVDDDPSVSRAVARDPWRRCGASAVGEGAMAVTLVHRYLEER